MKARLATIITLLALVGGTGGALAIAGSSGSGGSSAANGQYNPGKHCGYGQNGTPGKNCPKPMTVQGSRRSAKAGHRCFTFTVTSKGHRVRGARIKLHGHIARTKRNGRARLCGKFRPGAYFAWASKKGYVTSGYQIRIFGVPRFIG